MSNTDMNDDTDEKGEMGSTCKSDGKQTEVDAAELLLILEAKYDELPITNEYAKDLTTYLQYCKDVVFSGPEPSFEDHEEEKIIDDLWDFFQKKKDLILSEAHTDQNPSPDNIKEEQIRRLKSNMEENRFCYMPPRQNPKRFDYLHYVRKKDEGAYCYAAHADYYIVLRACARVVELDVRSLHQAVMHFERRLSWLEKKVDHCLKVLPCFDVCEFCGD